MSSLRPTTVIAALLDFLGGSQRFSHHPEGPGCSCPSCQEAWLRHHPQTTTPAPREIDLTLHRR